MRIAIGSDHRGFAAKNRLAQSLRERNITVADMGTDRAESVDYPDFAVLVARKVACGEADRGILLCGTGIGMSIAANKVPGIRAAAVHDEVTAELSRRHNDSNVLCVSADLLGERQIEQIAEIWLRTEFEAGRHARRVDKIRTIEAEHMQCHEE